ncbi:MAG: polyphosphate polymerase domain-containing protein [Gemmataceae bacterium]|nr:polyphosphate polymerase domain-containing protein [Gemmataceae bacterium]MCI0739215.1 polyphosphate polymerase domain-containing protein [Gemmataceae bacterium]
MSAPRWQSPSLCVGAGSAAYELKFLLSDAQAQQVVERASGRLSPDPHGDPVLGGAYRTLSLYCDTAQFEVFRGLGSFGRRKHRLRRYGEAPWMYLERKSKWGDRVKKRRTRIENGELAFFSQTMSALTWSGHWFHRHLIRRGLAPVCRIAYERVALVGETLEGPLRLTFDRQIRGVFTSDWNLEAFEEGVPILADHVVCEFKYRGFLPSLFKEIIQALQLTPCPVSKYRAFMRACSLAPSLNDETVLPWDGRAANV